MVKGFVPVWLENLTGDKKSNRAEGNYPFNIVLAGNQIEWIYHLAWLKLNKQPTRQEQGRPPKYVTGVHCFLYNRRESVVEDGSKYAPWDYLEHIINREWRIKKNGR